MKCPNCNFDNLEPSSFCINCRKPFAHPRDKNGSQDKQRPKKRKSPKKKAVPGKTARKPKAAAKKTSDRPQRKPKAKAESHPPEKAKLPENEVQNRQNILKNVEITPLDNVDYEGAAGAELKNIATLKENSNGPQVEPLASANAELPKVLWPEPPPEIKVEELLFEAQKAYETREAPILRPTFKDRVKILTSNSAKIFSHVGIHFPSEVVKPVLKPAFFAVAALVLGAVVWFALLKPLVIDKARWHSTVTNPVLAVMAFPNETEQDRFDPWIRALPHALAARLSHSADIRVLSPERVFSSLQGSKLGEQVLSTYSRSDLKQLAALTHADLIMTGSLARAAGTFQIRTSVKRAKYGDDIYTGSLTVASEADMLAQADNLAKKIDGELNFNHDANTPAKNNGNGMVVFPMPAAYKHFVEGQWRYWQQRYRDSINAFVLALEVDPEFAQAHVEMGRSYAALGYFSQAGKHYQAALELIDRLSEKERLQVQGELYRLSEKTLLIAQDIYLRLLEVSPDDPRTRVQLGELYTHLGQWDKAAGIFDLGLREGIETPEVVLAISMNHALQGDFKKARAAINSSMPDLPDAAFLRMQLAWIYLMQGDFNDALGELERGNAVHPSYAFIRMKGDVLLLSGDLTSASAEYTRLLSEEEAIARLWGRKRLAAFYLLQGKAKQAREQLTLGREEADNQAEKEWSYNFCLDAARLALESGDAYRALRECDNAWKIAMRGETREFPRRVLFLRGLAYLAQRRFGEAEKTAELLKSLCEKGPGTDRMRSYFLLKGKIEMSQSNYVPAIEFITRAVELLPLQGPPDWDDNDQALYYDALAEAYYARGDPGRAYEEWNKLRALLTGRLEFGDLFARTFYKQAKISEEKLFPDMAAKLYEKFLSFWGEGDLGPDEVSDARLRLQAIQGMLP